MQPTPQRPPSQPQNPQQPVPQYPQQPYPVPYPPQGYPQQPYPYAQPYGPPPMPVSHRTRTKDVLVFIVTAIAAVYIVWPSLIPDFVPDVLPFIGQIDDDTAVLVIISCFRYYGIDLTNIFMGWKRLRGNPGPTQR